MPNYAQVERRAIMLKSMAAQCARPTGHSWQRVQSV